MGLRRWKFFQLRRKEREEQGLAPRPPHREASFEPAVAKRRKKQWQNIKRRIQPESGSRALFWIPTRNFTPAGASDSGSRGGIPLLLYIGTKKL